MSAPMWPLCFFLPHMWVFMVTKNNMWRNHLPNLWVCDHFVSFSPIRGFLWSQITICDEIPSLKPGSRGFHQIEWNPLSTPTFGDHVSETAIWDRNNHFLFFDNETIMKHNPTKLFPIYIIIVLWYISILLVLEILIILLVYRKKKWPEPEKNKVCRREPTKSCLYDR